MSQTVATDTAVIDDAPEDRSPEPAGTPPSPPVSRRERILQELRFAGPIAAIVLAIKLMLFWYGVAVAETLVDRTFPTVWDRYTQWFMWDAHPYLSIAEHGYSATGTEASTYIVFFPGYPLLVHVANWFVPGSMLASAFVVSGIASITAAVLLAKLVRADGGDDAQATRAAWFLVIFPTAYFLHLPYTESLFISLLLGSFLAARTGHWAIAGIVGALAAFTRLNGVLLIPALAVEAYLQYRRTGKFERSWLWIGAIAAGLLVYLGINQSVFGDAFHFQAVQDSNWHKHLQNPIKTVHDMIAGASNWTKPGDRLMFVTQELLFLAIGLVAGILAWKLTRPSYAVWALLNVLLFASTSWVQSTPRYVLTIFPIFLILAKIKRPWMQMIVTSWSFAMLAWFAALFANGRWAF